MSHAADPVLIAKLGKVVIADFFQGGPKDGHQPEEVRVTDEIDLVAFSAWTSRRWYGSPASHKSNRLYWRATVQRTWETSVLRRGLEMVEGMPILFARRLSATRWEAFEVVALKRGAGFTSEPVRGFVFRLNGTVCFCEDRKRGENRMKRRLRKAVIESLNRSSILT